MACGWGGGNDEIWNGGKWRKKEKEKNTLDKEALCERLIWRSEDGLKARVANFAYSMAEYFMNAPKVTIYGRLLHTQSKKGKFWTILAKNSRHSWQHCQQLYGLSVDDQPTKQRQIHVESHFQQ